MIPAWTSAGVLPPIRPGRQGHDPDRSPYRVPLHQVVERFAVTPERTAIIRGLLEYRRALHAVGIVSGFQWLDGSFMEQVELLEVRPPNDVDVVTFFYLPTGVDQVALDRDYGSLFDPEQTKVNYLVDAYSRILGGPTRPFDVRMISYWYGMWSHRRDGFWKGFVQVDLDPNEDQAALQLLKAMSQEGGLA